MLQGCHKIKENFKKLILGLFLVACQPQTEAGQGAADLLLRRARFGSSLSVIRSLCQFRKMLYAPCGRAGGLANCLPQCATVVLKEDFRFFFQFLSISYSVSGFSYYKSKPYVNGRKKQKEPSRCGDWTPAFGLRVERHTTTPSGAKFGILRIWVWYFFFWKTCRKAGFLRPTLTAKLNWHPEKILIGVRTLPADGAAILFLPFI